MGYGRRDLLLDIFLQFVKQGLKMKGRALPRCPFLLPLLRLERPDAVNSALYYHFLFCASSLQERLGRGEVWSRERRFC